MSLEEFRQAVTVKELRNHGRQYEVFLGERSLGFAEDPDPVFMTHRSLVNNALYACTPDAPSFMRDGAVLPCALAANRYPDLAKRFPREYAMAVAGPDWNSALNEAAMNEGWSLFDTRPGLQLQRDDEADLLETDDDAWRLVMTGTGDHHIAARTIIFDQAPEEWVRMVKALKEGGSAAQPERMKG
jgi:hypothetical protein